MATVMSAGIDHLGRTRSLRSTIKASSHGLFLENLFSAADEFSQMTQPLCRHCNMQSHSCSVPNNKQFALFYITPVPFFL